ncbi:MAG: hypothetical protein IPL33_20495 [Sphingobacteriales bacterium]|nr:hypothetical protein [Sphingobacteriales bacterium]
MLRRVSLLCASDWESSHNRRQRPHSRRISSRGRFARISPAPLDAGYGRLCIVGGGFRLDAQQFHLLRSINPSLCYFALHLMRSNFTCYEALNRFTRKLQLPFAISRLT